MTSSIRYWQSRYKLIAVLLGVSPYLAYWFLKMHTAHLLSQDAWQSVALVTTFWSLNNLLVLVYFEYGHKTIKASMLQHQQAEGARAAAQHDLESLLNGVPYLLGYWDKSLHNRFSNKAYAQWFSVEPTELLGQHISKLLSPIRLETAMPLISKALAGEPCEYVVKLNNTNDHAPSHILVQYLPDVVNGEVNGFYAIGQDITEFHNTQTRLVDAKNRADQITAAKSRFVAMMSHEIRNPLHTILGLCNLLDEQANAETRKDLTDKLKHCSEDLVDLLTNSLDSFRLERGELYVENTEFDLWELVYGLSNHLYGGVKNADLELRIDFIGLVDRHWIGDALRIKQMCNTLISNACRFTETGFIHVVVEQASSDTLQLTVNDTGPGIAQESLEHLFEQQAQPSPSTTRLYGGSGLGLSLVKSLVEQMGGTLHIQNREHGQETSGLSAMLRIPLTAHSTAAPTPSGNGTNQTVQLAILSPENAAHTRTMLHNMVIHPTQGSALLITDHAEFAHTHLQQDPTHRALVLPKPSGRPQPVDHFTYTNQITAVQGPLQPLTILKWLQTCGQADARAETLPVATNPAAELVVLLVEDVKITRAVIRALLGKRGIQCLEAENGAKAVEIIQAQGDKIDFVLMDINMPVLNGIDATLQIRSDSRYRSLLVYALTGEDESTTTHSRNWSVFDKVLSKPLKLPALEDLLQTHRATKARAACSTQ